MLHLWVDLIMHHFYTPFLEVENFLKRSAGNLQVVDTAIIGSIGTVLYLEEYTVSKGQ